MGRPAAARLFQFAICNCNKIKGLMLKEYQVEELRSIGFRLNPMQLTFEERMVQIKLYQ